MSGLLYVGTSGWHYDHWKGPFYPRAMRSADFLAFYAERFRAVEINNSFYSLPKEKTLRAWHDIVPHEFLFTAKASRYITHMKKLKDPAQSTKRFLDVIETLRGKLGPILFQLPPRWRRNEERLADLLDALPSRHRYAFEFRDPSWFDDAVYDVLRKHRAAFCIYELAGERSPREVTSDWVYVRLHGPDGAYEGKYGDAGLQDWSSFMRDQGKNGRDVFCFFDNDQAGYAAENALRLQELLEAA